jgi:predicted glycoside hydrolase/deacetylase ChbG (UPF0249 family)
MLTILLSLLTTGPQLIIRGDDMGFSHSGNIAIQRCYTQGIVTSVEVIVPSPWFPEALKMLHEHPTIDVGIHLALTSEWDNVKWRPVAHVPSLVDADGYLFPMIWINKHYPRRALKENPWKLSDIEKEFRAQIELGKRRLPRVTHLSSHMGCHQLSPEVRELYFRLAKEYGLAIHPEQHGVKSVGFVGKHVTSTEKLEAFLKMLETLEPGKKYLFVEHPGLDTPELRAIYHIGYENVASDRQGVTDLFLDVRAQDAIKKKGIRLISYRDLMK